MGSFGRYSVPFGAAGQQQDRTATLALRAWGSPRVGLRVWEVLVDSAGLGRKLGAHRLLFFIASARLATWLGYFLNTIM